MKSPLVWDRKASDLYNELKRNAEASLKSRKTSGKSESSKQEGLFKQVHDCMRKLQENPSHPGLQTHPYSSIPSPYNKDEHVFEAYAQQHTPSAYRVFLVLWPRERLDYHSCCNGTSVGRLAFTRRVGQLTGVFRPKERRKDTTLSPSQFFG
jgi:hypothetical protein